MAKMRWYLPRSKIQTNKREAMRVAKEIRGTGNFKKVQLQKRVLAGDKRTKTPRTSGFWIKVKK